MGLICIKSEKKTRLLAFAILLLSLGLAAHSVKAGAQTPGDTRNKPPIPTSSHPEKLQSVKAVFKPANEGFLDRINKVFPIFPQHVLWSLKKPAAIKVIPKGLTAPLYGVLKLGAKEKPNEFQIAIDAPSGKPSRLFIDFNRNGDLTDDPAPEWNSKKYEAGEGVQGWLSSGSANFLVKFGTKTVSMKLKMDRYDTTEPDRMPFFLPLNYVLTYATEGDLKFGENIFHATLIDGLCRGDFRGSGVPGNSGVYLWVDRNGDGKMDQRGENYSLDMPFNIGGITYELKNISADGTSFDVAISDKSVAEVFPPPDLSIGKPALKFIKTAMDGSSVSFPQDYKGKKVLLYFWATWCGDCQREIPGVVAAYRKFHSEGLEILGVTVQHPNDREEVAGFVKSREIEWMNVFEGGMWSGELSQLYFVLHTPTPYLVDGDTGKIIASGLDLLGDKLEETLKKKLAPDK